MRFDTKLVHSGHDTVAGTGDVVPPIHMAVTYDRRAQQPVEYFYSRGENPTRQALETCLAALEDAEFALTFASGQAAGAAALSLLEPGDRLVCSDDVYGGTYTLLSEYARYGVIVDYMDLSGSDTVLPDDVRMVWIETPTNPLLKVADITEISRQAPIVLVDNTFASPVLQQPLSLGADITLYSTTKFIAGHSDVLGGALVLDNKAWYSRLLGYRTAVGSAAGPMDCFLVHRGLKTLSLRVSRQVANAKAVVAALRECASVGRIHYPGLAEHAGHEVARRQMAAPGSIVSFEYLGDVAKLLERVELFACAVSLGGVRSLIECPSLMTHRPVPRQTRLALGIEDNLVRVSLGIEDPADLVDDLVTAVNEAEQGAA